MMIRRLLCLLFVLLVWSSFAGVHAHKLSDMIGLNASQPFLVVGISSCQIASKFIASEESPCETVAEIERSLPESEQQCAPVVATFYPPPRNKLNESAQVLLLRLAPIESSSVIEFSLVDVPFPTANTHGINSSVASTPIGAESFDPVPFEQPVSQDAEIVGLLHDGKYSCTYILLRESGQLFCYAFLLDFKSLTPLYKLPVNEIFSNASNWASDPHREMVYYSLNKANSTSVYAIPFPLLLQSLRGGRNGELVVDLRPGERVQINGYLVFTASKLGSAFLSLSSPTLVEKCAQGGLPRTSAIFLLSSGEYCLLGDRASNDRELCLDERKKVNEIGLKPEGNAPGKSITWIHVVVVVIVLLGILAVILGCFRYWLIKKAAQKKKQETNQLILRANSDSLYGNSL